MKETIFELLWFINSEEIEHCMWMPLSEASVLGNGLDSKPAIALWPNETTMDFIMKNSPDTIYHTTSDVIAIYYL